MKIACISDTHNKHRLLNLPSGDVLIHCGDATMGGTIEEVGAFGNWFRSLPHPYKIFVPGNHDFLFQNKPFLALELMGGHTEGVRVLIDQPVEIEGLKFYGTPWVPNLQRWAFYGNSAKLVHQFAQIPDDTNVLITHGPPQGIHDEIPGMLMPSSRLLDDEISNADGDGLHVGSSALLARTKELPNLKLHCYGHIHEGYGYCWRFGDGTVNPWQSVNAAICTEEYEATNIPIVVEV